MSTRQQSETQHPLGARPAFPHTGPGSIDAAEAVALVAHSHRKRLLAVNGHRLTRADLEDCYSQTTLELLLRARRPNAFLSDAHILNALEQKLLSRIHDRRRAVSGRSPIEAAIAGALPLISCEPRGIQIADPRADVERFVLCRDYLRRIYEIAPQLSEDQRLILANQLTQELDGEQFCHLYGWSAAKRRKVTQRARARLRGLLAEGIGSTRHGSGQKTPRASHTRQPVGLESRDLPMNVSRPTSRQVPSHVGDRSQPRSHDAADRHGRSRRPGHHSPSLSLAASVSSFGSSWERA